VAFQPPRQCQEIQAIACFKCLCRVRRSVETLGNIANANSSTSQVKVYDYRLCCVAYGWNGTLQHVDSVGFVNDGYVKAWTAWGLIPQDGLGVDTNFGVQESSLRRACPSRHHCHGLGFDTTVLLALEELEGGRGDVNIVGFDGYDQAWTAWGLTPRYCSRSRC
jgi:hypothetical protein